MPDGSDRSPDESLAESREESENGAGRLRCCLFDHMRETGCTRELVPKRSEVMNQNRYAQQAELPQLALFLEMHAGYDMEGASWSEAVQSHSERCSEFQIASLQAELDSLLARERSVAIRTLDTLAGHGRTSRSDRIEILEACRMQAEVEREIAA